MTAWSNDIFTPPVVEARGAADDPAPRTSKCDDMCIPFFRETLHSWDCQILNNRDPFTHVLPDRSEMRQVLQGTPYEEVE